jgi:MYXO-CTERM domain-containing protein
MDFIERIFGVSPDNGDGSTEAMWIAALLIALAVGVWAYRRRRRLR